MHQSPMSPLTVIHVLISLIGIVSGLVVLFGFFFGRFSRLWTFVFLGATIATSITGFFFPIKGITPGIVLGILSLILLAVAIAAYRKHWTKTFVITCAAAEFFNVLVLIVQSFGKIGPLHVLAPKGSEPIVALTQGLALVFFAALAILDIRRHRFTLEAAI